MRLEFGELAAAEQGEEESDGGFGGESDEPFGDLRRPERGFEDKNRSGQKNGGEGAVVHVQRADNDADANVIDGEGEDAKSERMAATAQVHPLQEEQIHGEPDGEENHLINGEGKAPFERGIVFPFDDADHRGADDDDAGENVRNGPEKIEAGWGGFGSVQAAANLNPIPQNQHAKNEKQRHIQAEEKRLRDEGTRDSRVLNAVPAEKRKDDEIEIVDEAERLRGSVKLIIFRIALDIADGSEKKPGQEREVNKWKDKRVVNWRAEEDVVEWIWHCKAARADLRHSVGHAPRGLRGKLKQGERADGA